MIWGPLGRIFGEKWPGLAGLFFFYFFFYWGEAESARTSPGSLMPSSLPSGSTTLISLLAQIVPTE